MPKLQVLERPLSVLERSSWHVNQVAAHNIQAIARVEGLLETGALRRALDSLACRYPLLGARVTRVRGRLSFQSPGGGPIPLRVRDLPEEGWVGEAERELNLSVPCETGPLARCVLLRHGEASATLLLTFLHAIGDGVSGFLLVRDLLRHLASPGDPPAGPPPAELPASLAALLPPEVKGWRGSLGRLRLVGRECLGYLRQGGVPRRLRFDSRPPYLVRWTRLLPYRFEREFTDRLLSRARREGTSVHGAICAAGLLAVSRAMADGQARVLACTSAVDMRARLDSPVGEQAGLYVSVLWAVLKVRPHEPFWELARRVREELGRKIARGDPARVAPGGGLLLSALERVPGGNRSERIVRAAETIMFNFKGTGVSNVGVLPVPERLGGLKLESLSFAGSLVNLGYCLAVVNTFDGVLHLNYLYNEPLIRRRRAVELAESAVKLLLDAVA